MALIKLVDPEKRRRTSQGRSLTHYKKYRHGAGPDAVGKCEPGLFNISWQSLHITPSIPTLGFGLCFLQSAI